MSQCQKFCWATASRNDRMDGIVQKACRFGVSDSKNVDALIAVEKIASCVFLPK